MSPKALTDAIKPGISAAELEIIRQRLAEGFYERQEIRDTVVEAVRKELDGTRPLP